MKTYCLYLSYPTNPMLTMEQCHVADRTVPSGMAEQVTENMISFHDIACISDVEKAIAWAVHHVPQFDAVELATERVIGSMVESVTIVEYQNS